jgi:DNA-binding NtrC family response regulator
MAEAAHNTILIVDDRVEFAENIAEILSDAGYETAIADSSSAAEQRARAGDLRALITDYRLGDATGAELIARLRKAGVAIPAVVVSAHTDPGTIEDSRRAGAIEFLPKPIDIPRLLTRVATL